MTNPPNDELIQTEAAVASLLRSQRLGVDLHCHFEGVMSLKDLKTVATALDSNALLRPETWDFIAKTMSDPTISLQNFSKRLTARWMRIICVAALKHHGTPVEESMRLLFTKALEVMYAQGLSALELMVSVYSLSASGDFDIIPLSAQHTAEEEELINEWNASMRQTHAVSLTDLLRLFNQVIASDQRFIAAGINGNKNQMQVGLKFMIRREKDHQFANDSSRLEQEVAEIKKLYDQKLIVGLDIAGDEYEESGSVSNYSQLLAALNEKGIPFTIHAGEVSSSSPQAELCYQNLHDAANSGARRIGHAVRLFDQTPEMQQLLLQVLEQDIYLEVNVTSNAWTGAADSQDSTKHPIIRALNGDHPLFETAARQQQLRDKIIIGDDDPVIVSPDGDSFIKEMALIALYTNNLSETSLQSMLVHRQKIAQRGLLTNN